ncbi:phosphonate ABC transporter, permease protein PhnE [Bosea sp. NBC_00550]|uniref:phosphonate ABC transporter, permease protein PhnE n=1 Tax=Bosea sp. NBC_00550 TaxID=2969621 RepID=UPI002230C399|nr:phosphonate ABC transporter, permease protein PhnE [Bosea sp. NBC_00550]UZF91676.1 phosphonate ABC transporter, permease protein PhnE [Bosea sp. NBC_00550]
MSLALDTAERSAILSRHQAAIRGSLKTKLATIGTIVALLGIFLYGLTTLETTLWKIIAGLGNLGSFVALMLPPHPGSWTRALIFVQALFETVAIAFLGTVLAAALALPLGFIAARNVVANRVVHFLARRSLDTVRGVDALIWALIWVNVVGLGPFAGMLAIMTSDLGAFGKLYSEAIEAADRKAVEGVASVGGGKAHEIRFGLLPQVLPVIASQVLYYIESNTRSSTIIGIVGAGGIGLYLAETIRTLEWQQVSFLILLILAAVSAIDFLSGKLRFAIIGKRAS